MLVNLAEMEHERAKTQRAIELVREELPRFRAQRDRTGLVQVLGNLAGYFAAVDDVPNACAAAREAIEELAAREPEAAHVSVAIEHLALALALGGDFPRAATLSGYSDVALRRQGYEREFTETTTFDRLGALLSERLGPDEFGRLQTEGTALTPAGAVALALDTG